MKKFIAKTLVFATILTSLNLSWLSLEKPINILADTLTSAATDAYDAYNVLVSTQKTVDSNHAIADVLGLNLRTNDTLISSNVADATLPVLGNSSITGPIDGTYFYRQQNIHGTSQVKSGKWLNSTRYGAMTGTPTTEPIFVTVGGTQWIVDLQYRYVSAPYVRTYKFNVKPTPNYRYYKLGQPSQTSFDKVVEYKAKFDVPYDVDPAVYTAVDSQNPDKYGHNFAYKYFEMIRDSADTDDEVFETVSEDNSAMKRYTFPNYTWNKPDPDTASSIEVWAGEADKWDNADEASVAPLSANVAEVTHQQGSTNYYTPNVARAILAKQQVRDVINELKAMYALQDDNYRADQGAYDINEDGLDAGKNIPDNLTFMYTYGGMVRHGNNKENTIAANNPPKMISPGNSAPSSQNNLWLPCFTSYLYDWDQYQQIDEMTEAWGSDTPQFQNLRASGITYDNWVNSLKKQSSNINLAYSAADKANSYFALNASCAPSTQYGEWIGNANTQVPCNLNYLNKSLNTTDTTNYNTTVALSAYNKVLAISAPLSPSSKMSLTLKELGTVPSTPMTQTYTFEDGGFLEIAYLYYRAVYGIMLNYGGWFYYDEAKELFDGVPGFPKEDEVNKTKYNKAVNCNLAICFGQGVKNSYPTNEIAIPFAIFPKGGDLDGAMYSNGEADNPSSSLVPVVQQTGSSIVELFHPGLSYGNYVYKVKWKLEMDKITDYSGYEDSVKEKYATSYHPGATDVAAKLTDDGVVYPACKGTELTTCTQTDCLGDNKHKCENCGGDGLVDCTTPGCTTLGHGGQGDSGCISCGGDGIADDEHTLSYCEHYTYADGCLNSSVENLNSTHTDRKYEDSVTIHVYSTLTVDENSHWTSTPKEMNHTQTLKQSFENVNWLDITGFTLWYLNQAASKGLDSLLAKPLDCSTTMQDNVTYLLSNVTKEMGYEYHNIDDSYLTGSGTTLVNDTTYMKMKETDVLQREGRVMNSFNYNSAGNFLKEIVDVKSGLAVDIVQVRDRVLYYRKSDVPAIGTDDSISNLINLNASAFKLTSGFKTVEGDTLEFEYNPMSQGGRSHTTFDNFVNQAYANTLYFKDKDYISGTNEIVVKDYSGFDHGIAYSNSLLIQGDYMSLNTLEGNDVTIAGCYYDSWNERGVSDDNYYGGKFSLVPPGCNKLSVYASTCLWIPARLSVILARGKKEHVYMGSDSGSGNIPTSTADCWIIHSFCGGINGSYHNAWDRLYNVENRTPPEDVCGCNSDLTDDLKNDKGDVNTLECPTTSKRPLLCNDAAKGNKNATCFCTLNGSGCLGDDGIIKLYDVCNNGYYTQFHNNLNAHCYAEYTGTTDYITTIHIAMDAYLKEGMNTENIITNPLTVQQNMPYVGYQSEGIDDKIISIDGSSTTQDGYFNGTNCVFDKSKSFLNYAVDDLKTFRTFGADEESRKKPVVVASAASPTVYEDLREFYPYWENLNVDRHLANGRYDTGIILNNYKHMKTVKDAAVRNVSYLRNYNNTAKDLTVNTTFLKQCINDDNNSQDVFRPNNIVIYNPVATTSSHIRALSEFLPDAANKGSSGAYLSSFNELVKRDTRLTYTYNNILKDATEQYVDGNGIYNPTSKATVEKEYVLKECSEVDTTHYTSSDYELSSTSSGVLELTDNYLTIETTGKYTILMQQSGSMYTSISTYLREGDVISQDITEDVDGEVQVGANAIYKIPNKEYLLNWSDIVSAFNSYKETSTDETIKAFDATNVGIPLLSGTSIYVGTDDLYLDKGDLISFELEVSDNSEYNHSYISNALELSDVSPNIDVVSVETIVDEGDTSKTIYKWYLEAKTDTLLGTLCLNVSKDCFIWASASETIIETHPVVLCNLGTAAYTGPVSSYGYFYDTYSYSKQYASPKTFVNNYCATVNVNKNIDYDNQGVVLQLQDSVAYMKLKSSAKEDPHKVPNTNWRYYVLGWKTHDGGTITSINDPKLSNNDTLLVYPSGRGSITVAGLRSSVTAGTVGIYCYNGNYGLIDLTTDANANVKTRTNNRESVYTGLKIIDGTFDTVAFGEETSLQSVILPGAPSSYLTPDISNKSYECVFLATDGDSLAYDVKYSKNTRHKYPKSSVKFSKDWDVVNKEVASFSPDEYKAIYADSLSLDDEFTIYWDNYAQICPTNTPTRKYVSYESTPGVGYHINQDTYEPTEINTVKGYDFWTSYLNTPDSAPIIDTTKWIYNKYVIFNVDMYAFTEHESFVYDDTAGDTQNSKWNPTTPAYKADGTPNNIVYIPAGQKVYLGYYSISSDPTVLCKDDSPTTANKRFVDYGCSGKTKDPNGKLYTYHFWCPLSNGEADNVGTVQFVVNAINSVKCANDTTGSKGTVATDNGKFIVFKTKDPFSIAVNRYVGNDLVKDQWGNQVIDAVGIQLNSNTKTLTALTHTEKLSYLKHEPGYMYMRYNNSVNSQSFSIEGSVGALTVLDSGDPRYQDTFKLATTDTYAVSPIVKAILSYSNKANKEGSQNMFLTDIIDVRGRRVSASAESGYASTDTVNTYGSSWYADNMNKWHMLPITENFNSHEELRSSLTKAKLGYQLYCSLDTIGNYYGSRGARKTTGEQTSNGSLDYGQTKVQIRPMYVALKKNGASYTAFPVDVYMRKGSSYELINAGNIYATEAQANAGPMGSIFKYGPYYLDDVADSNYAVSIETNTGTMSELDQNMKRFSVTDKEAEVTNNVLLEAESCATDVTSLQGTSLGKGVTTSVLNDRDDEESVVIGTDSLVNSYTYGNGQMLFLREFNRTFTGGATAALNEVTSNTSPEFIKNLHTNSQKYSQKWRFNLGLPSSAIFVKHGDSYTNSSNILGDEYVIVCLLDIYAIGEKWAISYDSPLSDVNLVLNGKTLTSDVYNVYKQACPNAVPICVYDLADSSSLSDKDSYGSH